MIRGLRFVLLISLISCTFGQEQEQEQETTTTRVWKRKKPAYWEFPETTTSEKPDTSAELCKTTNMDELGANITAIVSKPVRGQAESLLHSIVTYVLTLHRFIRKCNTEDEVAKKMAKDLIRHKRPKFLDMELDMPSINLRVGFDKYEFQHFQWVVEDIQQSWEKLQNITMTLP